MQKPLKYVNHSIVFQEVPNEISLAFDISGCPHHCEGCHSPYLWEDVGQLLLPNITQIIKQYEKKITCVCLMGGDQNCKELFTALAIIKSHNLKTCVYSGVDNLNYFSKEIIEQLDYIKIGHYDNSVGGLNCKTTNQKMYNLQTNSEIIFYH